MNKTALAAMLAACGIVAPAEARTRPGVTWVATRTTDPITGGTSCTVTASDQAARLRFTRSGVLYPVVELNSEFGLLVGVSSGGSYRMPTGDILWRVDGNPFRTIEAKDNPAAGGIAAITTNVADQAMQSTIAHANRMVAAMTATSTMASGEGANAMLAEMLKGEGLIFRPANIQTFGLSDRRTQEVGQVTRNGLKPIPLDDSFRASLAKCGIAASTD